MTQENSLEVLKKLKMKVSDIVKEGILSKMMGIKDPTTRELVNKYNLKQAQIASAPPNWSQTSGQTQTTSNLEPTQPISGFEVISDEPAVIRHNKIDYALDDNGKWGRLVKGKRESAPLTTSFEKLLDKTLCSIKPTHCVVNPAEPKTAPAEMPDISQLSPQEREELKKRLKASLKVSV